MVWKLSASMIQPRIGNRDAELMLLVPLALQRNESQVVVGNELQQRAGRREQRRCLVVVSVKRAEHPMQSRHLQRRADARADGVFRDAAGEVRRAHARRSA